jgi:hypothetical protein
VTVAQEITLDIDYASIESLRRLYCQLGQERDFLSFIQNERNDRILKLAKVSKRLKFGESLTRIVGFYVVQLHLSYNLPSLVDCESEGGIRQQLDSTLMQLQKYLEHYVSEAADYEAILEVKREMVVFVVALRD